MRVMVAQSAGEIFGVRPLWEELYRTGKHTLFQSFEWNLIAAQFFGGREAPYIVVAQDGAGEAIIPATRVHENGSLSLLGETLFDYRAPLWRGDDRVLRAALARLSELNAAFSCSQMRHESLGHTHALRMHEVVKAPCIRAELGFRAHSRLRRNLKRMIRTGAQVKRYLGDSVQPLLRHIYQQKAKQPLGALFKDYLRIAAVCAMAFAADECCEVVTLEAGSAVVAALVTFLDGSWRRFYTVYFDPKWAHYSPGLTLIHHVCEESAERGLSSDFMTGEQPYKLRLANDSVPICRAEATSDELARIASPYIECEAA